MALLSIMLTVIITEAALRVKYTFMLEGSGGTAKDYMKMDNELGYDINNKSLAYSSHKVEGSSFPIWSNELGCFDKPYEGEKEVIILVGDSFTWGFVPLEHNYGTVIETMLNNRTLKCGVYGFETKRELVKAKRVVSSIKTAPSLIVVGYFLNDVIDTQNLPDLITGLKNKSSEKRYLPSLGAIRNWLANNSILYNFIREVSILRNIMFKIGFATEKAGPPNWYLPPDKYPWLKSAWDMQMSDISAFKAYSDSIGSKLLFVLIPERVQVYDFLRAKYQKEFPKIDFEMPQKIMKDFLVNNSIDHIDLLPLFRLYADQKPRKFLDAQKDLYYRRDPHWSRNGHKLAGLLVSKQIAEMGIIELQNKKNVLLKIEAELQEFNKKNQ